MSTGKLPDGVNGTCDQRFSAVADILARQIETGEHHGISCAAYFRGEPVVDLWGGKRQTPDGIAPWQSDTMSVCWSTTKGLAATALHIAMDRAGIDYDAPVASVWPEFGTNGKEKITIRQVLCHEAGVPQIRDVATATEVLDFDFMVSKIEGLEPMWEPGTANAYHAINFAWLVGETLHRIDGRDVPTFLAEELAGPLGLDGLFIGLPSSELPRVAPLIRPDFGVLDDETYENLMPKDSVVYHALGPRGDLFEVLNSPAGYQACIPSISGVFTARSVAKVYALLERRGTIDGHRLLSEETVATATTVQSSRMDGVINKDVGWRLGYMSASERHIEVLGPNAAAYGHVGLGGTYGAADPGAEVAYSIVYDQFGQMEFLGGPRGVEVSRAIVHAAEASA